MTVTVIRKRSGESSGPTIIRIPRREPAPIVVERRPRVTAPVVHHRTTPMSTGEVVVFGVICVGIIVGICVLAALAAMAPMEYDDPDIIIID